MNNIEKILKESAQRTNINVPLEFTNTIKNALQDTEYRSKKSFYFNLKVASICVTLLLITGITFAISYKNKSETKRMLSKDQQSNEVNIQINDGIKEAINNKYFQELNQEYIIDNNLGIKVDSLIMDDFNLYLLFNIKYNTDIENIEYIKMKDITIIDENQNLIYDGNEELINSNTISTGLSLRYKKISNDNFNEALNLKSNQFPRSQKLYISIKSIEVYIQSKGYISSKKTKIEGDWNLQIDIDEKMINRELIKFEIKDNNQFEVITALAGTTQSIFHLKTDRKDIQISSIELTNENNTFYKTAKYFSITNNEIETIFDTTLFELNNEDKLKLILYLENDENIIINLRQLK